MSFQVISTLLFMMILLAVLARMPVPVTLRDGVMGLVRKLGHVWRWISAAQHSACSTRFTLDKKHTCCEWSESIKYSPSRAAGCRKSPGRKGDTWYECALEVPQVGSAMCQKWLSGLLRSLSHSSVTCHSLNIAFALLIFHAKRFIWSLDSNRLVRNFSASCWTRH